MMPCPKLGPFNPNPEACIEVPINFNRICTTKAYKLETISHTKPSRNETKPVETGPICKYSSTLNLPLAFYET